MKAITTEARGLWTASVYRGTCDCESVGCTVTVVHPVDCFQPNISDSHFNYLNMVKNTTKAECKCETSTHLRIEELKRLESLHIVVSSALEDVTGRGLELYQVITC